MLSISQNYFDKTECFEDPTLNILDTQCKQGLNIGVSTKLRLVTDLLRK